MSFYRPLTILLLSVLLLEAGIFFHWHDMQTAVPKIRTLMPMVSQIGPPKPPGAAAAKAQELCLSETPLWRGKKTQMDYCMLSANAGNPEAQAIVAQFYLDGSTPASQAQAYAWLRTASANNRDEAVASAARLRLGGLMRQLDAVTIEQAEKLATRYMRKHSGIK